MKREFLKELGLEDEVIDKIMDENGKDINKSNEKIKTLETLYFPNVLFYGIINSVKTICDSLLYFPNVLFYGIITKKIYMFIVMLYFPNVLFYGIMLTQNSINVLGLYFPNVLFYGIINYGKNWCD